MGDRRRWGELAWTLVVLVGRGLVGAFAGLFFGGIALLIAFAILRLDRDSRVGLKRFHMALGAVIAAFALMAMVWGGVEIRGRKATTIKGMLVGTVVGVALGFLLGLLAGGNHGGPKAGIFVGLFVIAPVGTILGGLAAYEGHVSPRKRIADDSSADFR
ncbi:hypothetical protein [Paludisphaera rhizosphaerae]|uniref:hypothetical protein n=1 Tax=Paludisphaera rhizosphaerae TaxID=2711216 RepID=UPI0013ECBE7C|nr:hypothetical protein [Paludisphaera rhizosphaerae]